MGMVVSFQELQSMPAGTVFVEVDDMIAGDLCVKGDSVGDIDFWYQEVMCFGDTEEMLETLISGKDNGNQDIEARFTYQPDSRFYVLGKNDVELAIKKLQRFFGGSAGE